MINITLLDYLSDRFCLQEEDKRIMAKEIENNKIEAERQMYAKNPPYLVAPYVEMLSKWKKRYEEMGNKGEWYAKVG